jgi:hypothetical protein
LEWIQNCSSLQTVVLWFSGCSQLGWYLVGRPNVCLVELILQALAQNPFVTSLTSRLTDIPVIAWTSFFSTNATLVMLDLDLDIAYNYANHGTDMEAAAQALALHPSLEVIKFVVISGKYHTCFFRALESHTKLRHFTVSMRGYRGFIYTPERLAADTAGVLSSCAALQHATLVNWRMTKDVLSEINRNDNSWSPSITHLTLAGCVWDAESTQQFLDPDSPHYFQHVKHLCLQYNRFTVDKKHERTM